MNKNYLFLISFISLAIWADAEQPATETPAATTAHQMVAFQYDNEDLVNVVNYIASRKEVNLLLPTKTDEKLTGKLTWHLDKKVSIDQAWQLLQTILTIAGYSIIPRPTYYEVV